LQAIGKPLWPKKNFKFFLKQGVFMGFLGKKQAKNKKGVIKITPFDSVQG
jgi:hypothetical protein